MVAAAAALLISVLTPFAPGVSQGAEPPVLFVISPPSGLSLPVGQHIGVRYRFTGKTAATLELAADGVALRSDRVQPGQEVIYAWAPARPGLYRFRVRALAPDGTVLGSASLEVAGLPTGSRVRVP